MGGNPHENNMDIELLITPTIWLQLPADVRNLLAFEFKMSRSTTPRCVTQNGETKIESDGFTVDDLRALNIKSMQAYAGSKSESLIDLFAECAEKANKILHPPTELTVTSFDSLEIVETPPNDDTQSKRTNKKKTDV